MRAIKNARIPDKGTHVIVVRWSGDSSIEKLTTYIDIYARFHNGEEIKLLEEVEELDEIGFVLVMANKLVEKL